VLREGARDEPGRPIAAVRRRDRVGLARPVGPGARSPRAAAAHPAGAGGPAGGPTERRAAVALTRGLLRRPAGMPDRAPAATALPHETRLGDELLDLARGIAGSRFLDVAPFVPRDLGEQATRDHRAGLGRGHVLARDRAVAVRDQEPPGAPARRRRPRAHEDPGAGELSTVER